MMAATGSDVGRVALRRSINRKLYLSTVWILVGWTVVVLAIGIPVVIREIREAAEPHVTEYTQGKVAYWVVDRYGHVQAFDHEYDNTLRSMGYSPATPAQIEAYQAWEREQARSAARWHAVGVLFLAFAPLTLLVLVGRWMRWVLRPEPQRGP